MCEFCTQHGEGQKWYLVMRNYSRELWDQTGKAEFLGNFFAHFEEKLGKGTAKIVALRETLRDVPAVYRFVRRTATQKQKAEHWGQVVPIEDIERIVDMQDSIVRLPCACRSLTTGREARYCLGISADWTGILGKYPDYSNSLETLDKEEAKKLLRAFDEQGMIHSIWTFKTPFIGSICNCDHDCLAYRTQVMAKLMQVMFRAEYVGMVDWDRCNGCKNCLSHCQFGAIRYSNSMKRATIEKTQCYGCGVCRAVCEPGAITLKPRTDFARLPW
jgi:ferredoxin